MNEEAKVAGSAPTGADTAKIVVAIACVIGGIVGYYMLAGNPPWMRWLTMAGGVVLATVIFFLSQHGRDFWQFVLDSRVELRKVFWPNRQETGMTTLIVFGFVTIMSLFFWVLDLALASITRLFTGAGA
jgi:preprotein translocase subunit SecE